MDNPETYAAVCTENRRGTQIHQKRKTRVNLGDRYR